MEIVISRPKQYADRLRAYELLVDGATLAKVQAGEEIRVAIPENAKVLMAKIDWCFSNELNLSNINADEKIEVKNVISRKIWIPFYVFYAITFKRKSYLRVATVSWLREVFN